MVFEVDLGIVNGGWVDLYAAGKSPSMGSVSVLVVYG